MKRRNIAQILQKDYLCESVKILILHEYAFLFLGSISSNIKNVVQNILFLKKCHFQTLQLGQNT
jgi:hypothetical protein